MNIGIFSRYFPSYGGVETRVYNLVKILQERGHEVTIYASKEWLPMYRDVDIKEFNVIRVGYQFFELVAWSKLLWRHDVVEGASRFSWFAAFVAGHISATPSVATVHSVLSREKRLEAFPNPTVSKKIRNILRERYFLKIPFRMYMTPSTFVKREVTRYLRIPEEKIEVVPNGVDLGEFDRVEDSEKDEGLIVCISHLMPSKHLEDAILAMKLVIKKVPIAKLVVCGLGPEFRYLKDLINRLKLEEHVKLAGLIMGEKKIKLLKKAEIFAFPSPYEGFGIVVLEAFACHLPVVAVNTTAIPEIVDDGRDGLLVPPRSPESIAKALINLLENKDEARRMGLKGRKKVKDKFTWERIGNIYLKVLKNRVLGRS